MAQWRQIKFTEEAASFGDAAAEALLGPLLLMIAMGYGISFDVEDIRYAVLDYDRTPASRGYLEQFEGSRYFQRQTDIIDDDDKGTAVRVFDVYIVNGTNLATVDPEAARAEVFIEEDDGVDDDDDCDRFCDCFIATAAWGSWMHPHVVTLRRFRDDVLMQTGPGRGFVAAYYRYSPPLADFIAERPGLRAATRLALTPLVLAVEHPYGALGALLALWLGVRLRRRGHAPG